MKKKNIINRNYLEGIPLRNPDLKWSEKDGLVTLEIENKGVANRIAQKLFKKPKTSYIHLDEFGSFVWQQIDGEKDITHIGEAVEAKFGEKAHPLYERLVKYFEILRDYAIEYYGMLNQNNEKLSVKYESSVMEDIPYTLDDVSLMYETYMNKLKETAEKELRMKYTVKGAHRDDISFMINNMTAKDYASQGQVRSIAIALKLAEAKMIYEKSDDFPIMILDDSVSAVDMKTEKTILENINTYRKNKTTMAYNKIL